MVATLLTVAVAGAATFVFLSRSKGAPRHRVVSAAATSTSLPDIAPLTGLPPDNPAILERPAIDMKIDNDYYARPQSGIGQADVVYEEVVEGGITRWLAVFQSQGAPKAGPVRSVRQTDADLVAPIGGLFAYSGGIPAFVNDVLATGVKDMGATVGDPTAFYRDDARAAPDNLYTSTAQLWGDAGTGLPAPKPVFRYRTLGVAFEQAGSSTVGEVSFDLSSVTSVGWVWNSSTGLWDRSEGGVAMDDASGAPIAFTNVIIEYVPYHDTGFTDPDGNPVPDADTIGIGAGLVFSDGSVARVTWTKPTPGTPATYRDAKGKPVLITPGSTWVELLPTTQPVPDCSGGNGLASQICASIGPANGAPTASTGSANGAPTASTGSASSAGTMAR